jgi:hypothetical protein
MAIQQNKQGDNFFHFNKVCLTKEYAYYRDRWHYGYFVRYWRQGPIFNVYKTKGHALRSLKDCVTIRERNYTLAGKRIYSSYEYAG